MRQPLLGFLLILGIAAAAPAQDPQPRRAVPRAPAESSLPSLAQDAQRLAESPRRVIVSDGVFRTEMPVATQPHATDWPQATVPTRALRAGENPTVPEFRVRAWEEGGAGARVLVFAVNISGPTREVREEQIASVFVPIDQFVEIAATEKYNARRISLTAYIDVRRRRGYSVETPHIDIPLRPWTPLPRSR